MGSLNICITEVGLGNLLADLDAILFTFFLDDDRPGLRQTGISELGRSDASQPRFFSVTHHRKEGDAEDAAHGRRVLHRRVLSPPQQAEAD